MRIANNIMAMNTHRVYSINNTNISKSIEKLSSGYRINRAGDDAAGLAISEKMRAQIRGLQMASKNSQDGISMVQTAEGALQTTHDILQRMREIAVQSASDTNETTIDRAALDKEFQALMAEIDDTASKTAFNDQKLIDGTFQKTAKELAAAAGFATVTKDADGSIDKDNTNVYASYATEAGTYSFAATTSKTTVTDTSQTTVVAAKATADPKPTWNTDTVTSIKFEVVPDTGNWAYDMTDGDTYTPDVTVTQAGSNLTFNLAIDGDAGTAYEGSTVINLDNLDLTEDQDITLDFGKGVTATIAFKGSADMTVDEAAAAIKSAIEGIEDLEFEAKELQAAVPAKAPDITATGTLTDDGTHGITGISLATTSTALGALLNDEDATLTFVDGSAGDGSDTTVTLVVDGKTFKATDATPSGGTVTLDYDNGGNAGDPLTGSSITLTLTGTWDGDEVTALTTDVGSNLTISFADGVTAAAAVNGYEGTYTASSPITLGSFDQGADVSNGSVYNQTYTLSASATGTSDFELTIAGEDENGDATSVSVKINDAVLTDALSTGKLTLNLGGSIGTIHLDIDTDALDKAAGGTADADYLAEALASYLDGKTIEYSNGIDGVTPTKDVYSAKISVTNADGTTEDIKLKAGMSSITTSSGVTIDFGKELEDTDLETEDALESFLGSLNATVTIEETTGKNFVVQTGANEGDELSINIDAMNSWTLGIDKSSIATREAASKAITAVNDAINQVSMQRADLGALQNRLEFKIQNLDISAENLQSAESRIRDLDMAAEMTTFTRNNILAQAATAMLAQANSLPQGVLQLLG